MSLSIVKVNGMPNSPTLTEYIIDGPEDINDLPTNVADGSCAYTPDLSHIYNLKSGVWVEA